MAGSAETMARARAALAAKRAEKIAELNGPLPEPSDEDMLEATEDSQLITTRESWEEAGVEGASDTLKKAGRQGVIEHTTHALVTLYDAQGNARMIPRPNLRTCLASGLFARCPLCKGRHNNAGPNQCPARETLLVTACPICGKPLYETRSKAAQGRADVTADNYVAPVLPEKAARGTALQRRLNEHMLAFHPSEAYTEYGLQRSGEKK